VRITGRIGRRAVGSARLAGLALGALALAGCGSAAAPSGHGGSSTAPKTPIKIGMAVGLTGYLSGTDTPFSEGARLAVDWLNQHGGIAGHPVQLYVRDMASNAASGVTVTNQLLNQNGVDVLVNGSTSAATAAEAPIASARQVPIIAASVLPSKPAWVFSTLQPVTKSDQAALGFVQKDLHAHTIAVLYSETPYGQQASALMGQVAQSYGLRVVSSQGVPTDATDVTPELQQARAAGAQAIVDVLTGPVHIVEAKDAASLGLTVPLVMGQDSRQTLRQAAAAYPQTYFVALAAQAYPHNADPAIRQANATFAPLYQKAYGSQPGYANAARGWDSIQILAAAVRASGAVSGQALRDALEHVSYAGCDSEYRFTPADHTGQAAVPNPMTVAQYQGDSLRIVYTPPQ
jgi:branched-chain amino acid transport system substrate-binding protein